MSCPGIIIKKKEKQQSVRICFAIGEKKRYILAAVENNNSGRQVQGN